MEKCHKSHARGTVNCAEGACGEVANGAWYKRLPGQPPNCMSRNYIGQEGTTLGCYATGNKSERR